MSAELN